MNQKILFIMQQVSPGTHMDYVYEMARTLREDEGVPLELLLEKPHDSSFPEWVTVQQLSFAPLRALENFYLILRARLTGTKTFYIHYSYLSAITAGLVTKVLGGRVLYWNAGMPWQYKRKSTEEWYQRVAFRLIDTLVTGAEALIPGYTKMYGLKDEQLVVIPNWIDRTKINLDTNHRLSVLREYGIPDDAKVILFVHKLSKRKGANFLPDILAALEDKNAHLIVAGSGPLRTELEAAFADCGLTERAHLLGSVPRSTVENLYQAADVFLMPSEEEGSPHSLIETLAYQVPFVAFAVGGVGETATAALADYVVPFGEVKYMATKINGLLQNSSEYKRVQQLEAEVVSRYDKSVVVALFKKLLTE